MAEVASKAPTTALFLSTIVTRTRRQTEVTKKKPQKPDGKPVLCQRTFSSVFRAVLFHTVKLHSLTQSVWGPLETGKWRRLHSDEPHISYCSPNIIRSLKGARYTYVVRITNTLTFFSES